MWRYWLTAVFFYCAGYYGHMQDAHAAPQSAMHMYVATPADVEGARDLTQAYYRENGIRHSDPRLPGVLFAQTVPTPAGFANAHLGPAQYLGGYTVARSFSPYPNARCIVTSDMRTGEVFSTQCTPTRR